VCYIAIQIKKSQFQYTVIDYEDISDKIDYSHLKNIDLTKRLEDKIQTSISRAKRTIIDYGLNNEFNYFVTITFDDDKKCNSFDYDETKKKLLQSFNNFQKRKDKNFKYLIVPEIHDSGRIHFHGWFYTERDDLLKYMFYDKKTKHRVYRHETFFEQFGAITCVKINDYTLGAALYIVKYISKDLGGIKLPFKQYYFASKGLKRSEVIYKSNQPGIDLEMLLGNNFGILPNADYQDFYCKMYRIDNDDLIRYIMQKNDFVADLQELVGITKIKEKTSPYDFMESD